MLLKNAGGNGRSENGVVEVSALLKSAAAVGCETLHDDLLLLLVAIRRKAKNMKM